MEAGRPKLKRKESIQNAARKLFLQKGFDGTTIRSIAQEAHVSPDTIYSYFKSKQALFDCLGIP